MLQCSNKKKLVFARQNVNNKRRDCCIVPKREDVPKSTARIVVRKYGNRRLYDTSRSRYINLDELAGLVRQGRDVQVVDAATAEDLTSLTLAQIMVEEAKQQPAGYPLELLRQVIAASNHAGREFLAWYLKAAVEAYEEVKGTLSANMPGHGGFSPVDLVRGLVAGPDKPGPSQEIAELKQRIADLETRQKKRGRRPVKKNSRSKSRAPAGKPSPGKPRR